VLAAGGPAHRGGAPEAVVAMAKMTTYQSLVLIECVRRERRRCLAPTSPAVREMDALEEMLIAALPAKKRETIRAETQCLWMLPES
jgi:hypothetical protein